MDIEYGYNIWRQNVDRIQKQNEGYMEIEWIWYIEIEQRVYGNRLEIVNENRLEIVYGNRMEYTGKKMEIVGKQNRDSQKNTGLSLILSLSTPFVTLRGTSFP